ncbi:rhomboid family intramembrane serine protease [Sulfitobacter aestuariivivens]|uniref:Rhomboid family intramembrane serine protease n=1 Tax=Sulfitobacter aestuariivivens TaxID=2766981 RepID=A0A927D5Z1_9RHOB|nr:rhomboid family intramembrane serine protease [Sulfitobacter aestuariivivens]MBD3665820.1 rhomboid family intramembrane serine protease [Sulfitobacter aestuariivivens]
MQDPEYQPPVNPLPPAVVVVFLIMAGIEAMLSLGEAGMIGGRDAVGWRLGMIRDYGFSGDLFDWMLANGRFPLQEVARLVTYPFIHLGFTQSLFAMVLLLALGKMVAEVMGQFAFLTLFFVSGIGGAVIYALLLNDPIWLVGGYPSTYGLIGGYTFVLWRTLEGQGARGAEQLRAFTLIALLMAIQLIWGILFVVGTQWVAELAGFVCGFALSFVMAPGEWARMRDRMRRR